MSTTVQNLVDRALTMCGKLGPNRGSSTDESTVAFGILNAMLDGWAVERCYVFGLDAVAVSVTAGTRSYALNTRPTHIERADFVVTAGGMSYPTPLQIVGAEGYNAVASQGDQTPFPRVLWCDYGITTATVYIAPMPSAGTLNIYTWHAIAKFTALTDVISFPSGVEHALVNILAATIAPAFSRDITPGLAAAASASKAALDKINLWHAANAARAAYPDGATPGNGQ